MMLPKERLRIGEGSESFLEDLARQEESFLKRFAHSRLAQGLVLVTALLIGERLAEGRPLAHVAKTNRPVPAHKLKIPAKQPPPKKKVPKPKLDDAPSMEGGHVASLNAWNDQGLGKEIAAAEHFGLKNFKTEKDLVEALARGELMEMTPGPNDGYAIDEGLGEKARPESRHFYASLAPDVAEKFKTLAKEFYQKFNKKLILTSAVRTERYVDWMRKGNRNVAPEYTSSHLKRGGTLDFAYYLCPLNTPTRQRAEYKMTLAEESWIQKRLLAWETFGLVQASQEQGQKVFHVMFYPEAWLDSLDTVASITKK